MINYLKDLWERLLGVFVEQDDYLDEDIYNGF